MHSLNIIWLFACNCISIYESMITLIVTLMLYYESYTLLSCFSPIYGNKQDLWSLQTSRKVQTVAVTKIILSDNTAKWHYLRVDDDTNVEQNVRSVNIHISIGSVQEIDAFQISKFFDGQELEMRICDLWIIWDTVINHKKYKFRNSTCWIVISVRDVLTRIIECVYLVCLVFV